MKKAKIQRHVFPRLISVAELEQILGVSKSTIYRWIRAGNLPPPRRIGPRRVGWWEDELLPHIRPIRAVAA
ncbi:MAG: helix-turn-helix domain-containing protein [Deltaproteobacteria bacterium]|nr:helix-turn-helix domain-containing protein [Deltaproteobacteria bacterium]